MGGGAAGRGRCATAYLSEGGTARGQGEREKERRREVHHPRPPFRRAPPRRGGERGRALKGGERGRALKGGERGRALKGGEAAGLAGRGETSPPGPLSIRTDGEGERKGRRRGGARSLRDGSLRDGLITDQDGCGSVPDGLMGHGQRWPPIRRCRDPLPLAHPVICRRASVGRRRVVARRLGAHRRVPFGRGGRKKTSCGGYPHAPTKGVTPLWNPAIDLPIPELLAGEAFDVGPRASVACRCTVAHRLIARGRGTAWPRPRTPGPPNQGGEGGVSKKI